MVDPDGRPPPCGKRSSHSAGVFYHGASHRSLASAFDQTFVSTTVHSYERRSLMPPPSAVTHQVITQSDLDLGVLICGIGVAPLSPAEFVILRGSLGGSGSATPSSEGADEASRSAPGTTPDSRWRFAGGCYQAFGSSTTNVAPPRFPELRSRRPPILSVSSREMYRPSPVPLGAFDSCGSAR